MKAEQLQAKFAAAFDYTAYLATGTPEQQRRWTQVYDAAHLTDPQIKLVKGFVREMHILVISGIWCGDCVQQVPLAARIAEQNPDKVRLRILDRDAHRDLIEQFHINAGDRVPVALFLAEDFELCQAFGDRSLVRYRALAQKQLGPACPIAIAPPDADELAGTLADWLDEVERTHLMLRLSSRLRQKYAD